MNQLPAGWRSDRLKDVALINGSSLPADADPDYEFDYLEISNVNYNGVIDSSAIEHLRFEDAPSRARRRVSRNNTVISSVRPNLQSVAFIADGSSDLVCSTGFNVVQVLEPKLLPKFVYYALFSDSGRQYFEAAAKGVGYPAVDDKDFGSFLVPLPPLPEQERIATYLDASCAAIDAAVAAKRRQVEALNALRLSTISSAVTAGVDQAAPSKHVRCAWFHKTPPHWRVERLKDVVSAFVDYRGKTPTKTREGIPLVTARNIRDGKIDFSNSREYISEDDYDGWMVRGFPELGDVLITTEAPLGEVAAVEDTGIALAQRIVLLKTRRTEMASAYLRYFFLSAAGSAEITRYATGSTALGIKARWLKVINVLVPPMKEQVGIIRFLDSHCERIEPLIAKISGQIDTVASYRKSLIHECVTGQRRIPQAQVTPSQLSENIGQLDVEPSEEIGRLNTKSANDRQGLANRTSRRP